MGSVDEALAAVPSPGREALQHVIDVVRAVAPDAVDGVSYGVPALKVGGRPLIGVSASAQHLSIFPFSPGALEVVRPELDGYSLSKGTLRFTPDRPVPDDVIERLVRARLAEIVGS